MEKVKPGHIIGGLMVLGAVGAGVYALTRTVIAAPENIVVSDLTISPIEVYVDETVEISVIATNIGQEKATREIICEVQGIQVKKMVTLSPGESQIVTFSYTPTVAKSYSVSVDGLTGSFVALEVPAAEFQVTDLVIRPPEILIGATVFIQVTVTNVVVRQGAMK